MSGEWMVINIVEDQMDAVLLHVVRHGVFGLVVELHDATLIVQILWRQID
jgi:hypothetical protein